MAKMTYREQLLHPNWQRRRLEMLNAAGWECSNCGGKEQTLHVHHKQYFKGRMAWEYSDEELAVLCEDCHADEHVDGETLKRVLAATNTSQNVGLMCGFYRASDWLDPGLLEQGRQTDALAYAAGFVGYLTHALGDVDLMRKVGEYAASLATEHAESRMIFEHSRGATFGED